jgi:hypothetical protein
MDQMRRKHMFQQRRIVAIAKETMWVRQDTKSGRGKMSAMRSLLVNGYGHAMAILILLACLDTPGWALVLAAVAGVVYLEHERAKEQEQARQWAREGVA